MGHTISGILCRRDLSKPELENLLACKLKANHNQTVNWFTAASVFIKVKTQKGTLLIKPFEHPLVKNLIKDEVIEFACSEDSDDYFLNSYKNFKTKLEYADSDGKVEIKGKVFWEENIIDAIWDLLAEFLGNELPENSDDWEYEAFEMCDEMEFENNKNNADNDVIALSKSHHELADELDENQQSCLYTSYLLLKDEQLWKIFDGFISPKAVAKKHKETLAVMEEFINTYLQNSKKSGLVLYAICKNEKFITPQTHTEYFRRSHQTNKTTADDVE